MRLINKLSQLNKKEDTGNLPRIEVRIVDRGCVTWCGYAYLKSNCIFIKEHTCNYKPDALRHVVLHEIVHAVTGFRHDEACPLMKAKHDPRHPQSKESAYKNFKKYFK